MLEKCLTDVFKIATENRTVYKVINLRLETKTAQLCLLFTIKIGNRKATIDKMSNMMTNKALTFLEKICTERFSSKIDNQFLESMLKQRTVVKQPVNFGL